MEFTTDSRVRTLCFQRVMDAGGGRRARGSQRQSERHVVTVKTDVEIIVGNILQQILAACSLLLIGAVNCVRGHRLQVSLSRSAKRKLESLCTLQHSWES